MTRLSDQLQRRSLRKAVKGEVPEWWPAAQIAGAVVLVGALLFASLTHFGRKNDAVVITENSYSAPPAVVGPGFGTDTTIAESGTTTTAPSTSPTQPPAAALPTEVDAFTVAVAQQDGTQKAIPAQSWIAAKDHASLLYINSQISAVVLLQSTGSSNTFSISVSNGQATSNVQVTTVLSSTGAWVAS
jgi:hypothetical protein